MLLLDDVSLVDLFKDRHSSLVQELKHPIRLRLHEIIYLVLQIDTLKVIYLVFRELA